MKTVLTILASLTLFTSIASADHGCATPRRVVGYTRCGDPIVATYEYVGRSRCGDPVYQWVTHYPREREETRISIPMPVPSLSLYFGAHAADRSRYYPSHDFRCR
ncbi:MAG: hypothetical protein JWO89_2923 [Verrucomicrobiaceae bacterium]|nr:hypothetical protein [Verrucomicrobiaceae bacterium]